jgi:hypothetical protein
MRKKTAEQRAAREARRTSPDYPKSRVDMTEVAYFHASKYIPAGKHRTVPLGNR